MSPFIFYGDGMDNITQKVSLDRSLKEVNHILIDFQCMYDFDVSCVRYLVEHAKNLNLINPDIVKASSLSALRNLLLFRNTENPLSVCINDKYMDSIDDIYKELLDAHEKEILETCDANYIHTYINLLLKTDGLVEVAVNCENELQYDIASSSMHDKAKYVYKKRDLADYDTLYIKYVSQLMQYDNVHKKHIYMINGLYNFNSGMFKEEVLIYINNNTVSVIDQYKNLRIPAIYNILNKFKESADNDQRNESKSDK